MQVLQGEKNIGRVKLGSVLLKSPDLTQVEEKLTAWAVLQAKVELALRLKRVVHLHYKLVVHTLQNTPLVKRVLQLISAQNLALFEYFERVHFLCVLFLN